MKNLLILILILAGVSAQAQRPSVVLHGITIDTSRFAHKSDSNTLFVTPHSLDSGLNTRQATLVSGTNIKTINGSSILGSGDLTVSGGMTNPMTTQGDMIYGGASGTPTRLAGGVNNYTLKYNGTTNTPYWAPSAGGIDDVLEIAQNFTANRTINTAAYGLTLSATGATTALNIFSGGATGLVVQTTTGLPALIYKNRSTTNVVEDLLTIQRATSSTGADGIGGRINFKLDNSAGATNNAGNISFVFDDATAPHSSIQVNTNDTKVSNLSGREVTTTDATPTTLQTINITDETVGVIEIVTIGRTSGNAGKVTGKKIVGYRKDGGTLTLDALTTVLADVVGGDITTATWTITTSSNNIIVQVTGEATKTINWKCVVNKIDL